MIQEHLKHTWIFGEDKLYCFAWEDFSREDASYWSWLYHPEQLVQAEEENTRKNHIEVAITSMKQEEY